MCDDLSTAIAASKTRSAALLAAYDAAPPRLRNSATLVLYRCRSKRRCELLRIWQAPGGRLIRIPPYKLSSEHNAGTATAARLRNTRDGVNHWNPRVLVLEDLEEWGSAVALDVHCDHTQSHIAIPDLLADAATGKPGKPIERRYPR